MAQTIDIDYEPTPKQIIFHSTTANEVLYGGAAGGGKTRAIVMDALSRCLNFPETHAYCFRRTYTELEDTMIKEAKACYPKGLGRYNVGRHDYELINGSVIHFRHCASIGDMYNYAGAEIQWLYMDELTSFEMEIYTFLKTRLRAKKSLGVEPIVRCASNPGNIGHGWVKAYFVDAGPYGEIIKASEYSKTLKRHRYYTKQYIPALATDNPYITDDYIFELERKPEALRKALLYGHWDAFEGQVFTEWKDDPNHYMDRRWTHVIEPFPIPLHWRRYMSFDHGYSRPFSVGWWAMDEAGILYRYKEWYGWNGTPNKGQMITPGEIAAGILQREQEEIRENLHIDRIADPAIFDRSRGPSVADQMRDLDGQQGVIFRKGDNNRLNGLMQFHERLRFNEQGVPKVYFFRTCASSLRTIPALPYSLTKPEDVDTDAEDHCLIGSTQVLTEEGYVTLEDSLGSLRSVISHDGKPHACHDVRKTQTKVDVFTIETDDGRTVTATANHRFMLADGTWKRLDQLKPGDELMEVRYEGKSDQ